MVSSWFDWGIRKNDQNSETLTLDPVFPVPFFEYVFKTTLPRIAILSQCNQIIGGLGNAHFSYQFLRTLTASYR